MKSRTELPISDRNRSTRAAHALACLLGAALFAMLAGSANALPVARVRNMKPVVQIRSKGTTAFLMAHDRNALRFGDTVRTLAKGKADLLFANGTQLALRENTQIEIVAPESESKPLVIRVFGALSAVFVRPRGNTQIRTAAAIAAARGTEYLVSLPSADRTVVTVTEGSVDFFNNSGRVLVAANQQSSAAVGAPPSAPTATDVSGLLTWTADVVGMPSEFDLPFTTSDRARQDTVLRTRLAAVAKGRDNARAHRELAEIYLDRGQPALAQAQLALARGESGGAADDTAITVAEGYSRQLQGDTAAAIALYRGALVKAPADRSAALRLALALVTTRDFAAARAALPASAEDVQASGQPRAIAGLISLHEGKPQAAETELRGALRADPQGAGAQALLALSLLVQNRVAESAVAARRAALIAPDSAQAQGTLATVLFFEGNTREAARAASRAVAINPDSPFALLAEGRIALARLRVDEAHDALGQAQALAPDLPVIPSELAATYFKLGMLPKAEKTYRRALELSPDYLEAHNGLGRVLQAEGKTTEAEAEYARAKEIDPKSADASINLADLYIEQGRLSDADKELQSAAAMAPDRGIVFVRMAQLSLLRNNLFAAQGYARRAVSLLPASSLAHYQLGRIYLQQNRTAQAEQEFREAVALDRNDMTARYALGYAEGLVEQGRDHTLVGAANNPSSLGTAASVLDAKNLQTPGAAERLQAAIADPSVIAVATRAYGDTEVSGAVGSKNADDFTLSHVQQSTDRRRVIAATGEFHRDQGALTNSSTFDREGSVIFAQKARNNPSSLFFLGQYQSIDDGLNLVGDMLAVNATRRTRKPSFILGGNLQREAGSKTRFLLQYTDPTADISNLLGGGTRNGEIESFNGEVRHDVQLDERQTLNIGLFSGKRRRDSVSTVPIIGITIADASDVRLSGAYLRDEYSVNDRFQLAAEVRAQTYREAISDVVTGPAPFGAAITSSNRKTDVLPSVLATYQLNSRTGVRLRMRRVAGTFADFQLLAPTDPFFTTNTAQPDLNSTVGYGSSVELEANHTFANSTSFHAGLIVQKLHNVLEPNIGGGANPVDNVSLIGLNTGYDGMLTDNTSFFVKLNYQRVHDTDADQQVAESPTFVGEAGLQFVAARGFYVQPTYIYSASRFTAATAFLPRMAQGGFGVFNLRVGKRSGVRSEVFFELLNAFDKQYELFGMDRSGRQYRVGALRRF